MISARCTLSEREGERGREREREREAERGREKERKNAHWWVMLQVLCSCLSSMFMPDIHTYMHTYIRACNMLSDAVRNMQDI